MEAFNQKDFAFFSHDRLYQRVGFTSDDLKLAQTRELARLREVSLSAVPTWTIPTGVCASKFEHSEGVGHLARIVMIKPEFRELGRDLYFASLAHDLSTPPFSHLSESFLIKLYGVNHEEFIDEVLDGSEFAGEVQRQGGSLERIVAFVKGTDKPYSDLINGSIDLDNLDNTLRYGLSMGLFNQQPYSPEALARAYSMQDGKLVLKLENPHELKSWEACRTETYKYVYNPANLAAGMMVWRALYLAAQAGEVTKDYFLMTDAQAYVYLEKKCNFGTRTLVEQARRWQYYKNVFNLSTTDPTDKLKALAEDSWNRGLIADELSQLLSVSPERVAVFIGKDKGVKQINLPIVSDDGVPHNHTSRQRVTYISQVYVHPKLIDLAPQINDFMSGLLRSY